MSTFYMSQFGSIPMHEGDQDQSHLSTLTLANDTPRLYPFLMNTTHDQEASERYHHLKQQVLQQKEPDERLLCDRYIEENNLQDSGSWMPSKMRFIKKMMNSDQIAMSKPRRNDQLLHQGEDNSTSNSPTGIVRVCSDCKTTKTPLWRSGPHGPKSLCNACGIRQRKARRAAMAAATNGLVPTDGRRRVRRVDKISDVDRTVPFKKRFNSNNGSVKKDVCFKHVAISLGKNSAFHQVFPQDERDAAILLMALSCGLFHS